MKDLSRKFACMSMVALSLITIASFSVAGTFPDRPIKIIVGFPPGQSSDASARRTAQAMAEILKQSVIVDNRPGAAGAISHEAVKNAAPDGYTLLMGSTGTLAINPSLYSKLPYDPIKDFEPVALVSGSPLVLFTSSALPVKNFQELIAYVKARPGKITYGSSGSGTTGHIAMEMLKKATGIDVLHVPFKGSPPMVTAIMGGQVDFAFDTLGTVLPFADSGRIKLMGIATLERSSSAPKLPTLAEQGLAGFEASPWSALLAPKGTPPEIVNRLNEVVNKVIKEPAMVESFAKLGSFPLGGTPAYFKTYMQNDIARWGKAVKASGAQVD